MLCLRINFAQTCYAASMNKRKDLELTKGEAVLAKTSARRGRISILKNTALFEAGVVCLLLLTEPSINVRNALLGLMLLRLVAAMWRWFQVSRDKFQQVRAPQTSWPPVIKERGRLQPWLVVLLITAVWVQAHGDMVKLADALLFSCIVCAVLLFASRIQNRIVLQKGRLKSIRTIRTGTGKREESVHEILFSEICRVESPDFGSLQICRADKSWPMMIDANLYGVRGLAAVLDAIERHAPQATFDTGADLMRCGYFSW
jgi:hypothetical protein